MLKAKNGCSVSVCSWSLQSKPEELPTIIKDFGSPQVHLAIGDFLTNPEKAEKLIEELSVSATMIGFAQEDYTTLETIKETGGVLPNDCWETNLMQIKAGLELTKRLDVPFMSFHAGFINESDAAAFAIMNARIRTAADIAAANGVTILMETGQETAEDLAAFMRQINHDALGVNFDPANMILYDKGDPIEALKLLAPWIKHVHIKDAVKAEVKGNWGTEVPWGEGQVGADRFMETLTSISYNGAVAVEREAGEKRIEDIKSAIAKLTAN